VEKQLGIKSKSEIPAFGVDKYNLACRNSVFTYKDLWEKMTRRMGYWINFEDAYVTCTNEYIESVWWSLKTLFDKGLIYKDYKIVPQCPRSETVLSSHELALGYKMTKDPSVYILFKVKNADYHFLVWTTTPWTLISNVALALGADVDYVKVHHKDTKMVLAKARLSVLDGDYEIIEEMKGADLAGIEYEQLMTYVSTDKKAFYTILGDFVSTEDGSGIVHIAPAFGQDDYEISKKYGLPMFQPVTPGGRFTEEVTDFAGEFVKDADQAIMKKLRIEGKLYKKGIIEHSYPFSWRFDNVPVIYYARDSWFIRTTAVADRMVELNKTINWKPAEIGSGRFGNWLEENKDWALSRDRYWATPLPIWISNDGEMFAVGSIAELGEGFVEEDGKRVYVKDLETIDLHKPFVDNVYFERNGKIFKRTSELIDVWYDSGAMPFAQFHYPFENKEWFENNFPATYISEAIDQTRGWFYTLHALGTLLFDSVAYKNVLVADMILDKNGQKMSKSKGNTVDPFALFEKYGADATRWYLITNSPPWRPTLFNEDDLVDYQRKFFGTLYNTYAFFALYSNIDKFDFSQEKLPYESRPEIDRWIISKLNAIISEYKELMDGYDVTKASRLLSSYVIDDLSNWYVRRCRRRFWKSEMNENKLSAYQTLYECLISISKLASPFVPFAADVIYRNLNEATGLEPYESVHLSYFPEVGYRDEELEEKMDIAQRVVMLGRAMRAKHSLKVRQPLLKMMVAVDEAHRDTLTKMNDVILEELNIKEMIVLTVKDDFEIIRTEIQGWIVQNEEGITVALDTELTDSLIAEGYAREFVNRVQNLRKDSGFDVTDRITIVAATDAKLTAALGEFSSYIANETLASAITFAPELADAAKVEIDTIEVKILIKKALN